MNDGIGFSSPKCLRFIVTFAVGLWLGALGRALACCRVWISLCLSLRSTAIFIAPVFGSTSLVLQGSMLITKLPMRIVILLRIIHGPLGTPLVAIYISN